MPRAWCARAKGASVAHLLSAMAPRRPQAYWAQGGIARSASRRIDSAELHLSDNRSSGARGGGAAGSAAEVFFWCTRLP